MKKAYIIKDLVDNTYLWSIHGRFAWVDEAVCATFFISREEAEMLITSGVLKVSVAMVFEIYAR